MLKGRKSSFLDKLWRTSLKLPATPQTSLKRSVSREVMITKIIIILDFEQFGSPPSVSQDNSKLFITADNENYPGTKRGRGGGGRGWQKERQKQVNFTYHL